MSRACLVKSSSHFIHKESEEERWSVSFFLLTCVHFMLRSFPPPAACVSVFLSSFALCLSRACLGKTMAFLDVKSGQKSLLFSYLHQQVAPPPSGAPHAIASHNQSLVYVASRDGTQRPLQKPHPLFLNVSFVCPEPVLVNTYLIGV